MDKINNHISKKELSFERLNRLNISGNITTACNEEFGDFVYLFLCHSKLSGEKRSLLVLSSGLLCSGLDELLSD